MIKKLNLLGQRWKVRYTNIITGEMGLCIQQSQEILIDNSFPKDSQESTLIHEILEALFDIYGFGGGMDRERMVRCLEVGLFHVMSNNRHLFSFCNKK